MTTKRIASCQLTCLLSSLSESLMLRMLWKTGLSSTEMSVLRSSLTARSALRSSAAATLDLTSLRRSRAARVSSEMGILMGGGRGGGPGVAPGGRGAPGEGPERITAQVQSQRWSVECGLYVEDVEGRAKKHSLRVSLFEVDFLLERPQTGSADG